jgi:hypothetical protein
LVVVGIVPSEELPRKDAGFLWVVETLREMRKLLEGLRLKFGIGMSWLVWGRMFVLVTSNIESSRARGLDLMEGPRAAWIVSCRG